MIPPIAQFILDSNPQFASLHRHLTTNLLTPDGSTRASSEAHGLVSTALRPHLLRTAKEGILRSGLRDVARENNQVLELTPRLRELIATTSMILDEAPNTKLSQGDHDLLRPDIDAFYENVREIAVKLSKDLQRRHDLLCNVASASTTPSQDSSSRRHAANSKRALHKTIHTKPTTSSSSPSSLPAVLRPLLTLSPNSALQSSLTNLSSTALQHSSIHRTLLTTTLTHLERTTLGLYARHTKARSAHLSAVATGLAKRIEAVYLQKRNRVYSVDVQRALKNYQHHLDTVEDGLEEREAMLRGVVEEFDEVGSSEDGIDGGKIQSGLMREVGKRYGEVLREIQIVKAEMEKLRGDAVEKQSRSGRRGGRVSGAWG
jgi:hypothetical protein